MFVKVYLYKIKPEVEERFFEIQRKANKLYEKYLSYEVTFLRTQGDEDRIIEIQRYPNRNTYRKGMRLLDKDPKLQDIWESFTEILTHDPKAIQEYEAEEFLRFENASVTSSK